MTEERAEYRDHHEQRGSKHTVKYHTISAGGKMWLESLQNVKELSGLCKLAKLAGVKTVLEIGAGPCGTAVYFSDVVGPDGLVVSVDLPVESGGTPPQYEEMARAEAKNWSLVRGDSGDPKTVDKVRGAFGGRQVGLLFIDGEHTREAAERDLKLYGPLVDRNGIIAFHDITMPELWTMWCGLRGRRHPVRSVEFIEDKTTAGMAIGALIGNYEGFEGA